MEEQSVRLTRRVDDDRATFFAADQWTVAYLSL